MKFGPQPASFAANRSGCSPRGGSELVLLPSSRYYRSDGLWPPADFPERRLSVRLPPVSIETEQDNEPRLSFQHTVFCQAGLPYRNRRDPAQISLGGIVTNLPAVRAAKKINTLDCPASMSAWVVSI